MKIKKAFLVLFILPALCDSLHAMGIFQKIKSKFAQLPSKYPILYNSVTLGIGGSSLGLLGGHSFISYRFRSTQDVCPTFNTFAQNEFNKVGLKQATVQTSDFIPESNACTTINKIYINPKDYNRILDLLQNNPEDPELNIYKGILQHEAIHAKDRHILKGIVGISSSAIAAELFTRNLHELVVKHSSAIPRVGRVWNVIRTPLHLSIVLGAIFKLQNHFERQADAKMANHVQTLQGAAEYHRINEKYEHTRLQRLKDGVMSLLNILDPHDSHKKRAEIFEQRVKQLEKQNK